MPIRCATRRARYRGRRPTRLWASSTLHTSEGSAGPLFAAVAHRPSFEAWTILLEDSRSTLLMTGWLAPASALTFEAWAWCTVRCVAALPQGRHQHRPNMVQPRTRWLKQWDESEDHDREIPTLSELLLRPHGRVLRLFSGWPEEFTPRWPLALRVANHCSHGGRKVT